MNELPVIQSAEQAAELVADLAKEAASAGTFGVGAMLVDNRTGEILDRAANSVVGKGATAKSGSSGLMTRDPTAHSEMKLVRRYFDAVAEGKDLPRPEKLTIISSLEPCAMCAGAILSAGMNVGVVALDLEAGIGASGTERFTRLPASITEGAGRLFGYYEVEGLRPFTGSETVVFGNDRVARAVSEVTREKCEHTFMDSLERARSAIHEGEAVGELLDPAELPSGSLREVIQDEFPHAFALRLGEPSDSQKELTRFLRDLLEKGNESGGAAALLDPHGNLLTASVGRGSNRPTDTGLIEVIRTYSRARFEFKSDPDLEEVGRYLPHPKYCSLVRYPPPDPGSPLALMELGAYGSTMEGPILATNRPNLFFLAKDGGWKGQELEGLVTAMPPFYSDLVGIEFETLVD